MEVHFNTSPLFYKKGYCIITSYVCMYIIYVRPPVVIPNQIRVVSFRLVMITLCRCTYRFYTMTPPFLGPSDLT